MTVAETLATMIRNWPTLYASRMDALNRVFTYSWVEWENGEVAASDDLSRDKDGLYKDEEKVIAEARDFASRCKFDEERTDRHVAAETIRVRRENNRRKFIVDNAELIAIEEHSEFSFVPSFSFAELNRLPVTALSNEWKAALVEFCNAILRFTEKEARQLHAHHAPEYQDRAASNLKTAQETAREALARIAPELPEVEAKQARAATLLKLRFEAEKFGMKLVEINPD